jgi:tetratricopeptide (TPR) repeat protein
MITMLTVAALAGGASWREEIQTAQRLREAGRNSEAESGFREAVREAGELSLAAPETGVELNALGEELYLAARYADAEAVYRLALQAFDRPGSEISANRALTAGNLGVLLLVQGRYAEAERRLVESVRQLETLKGPDSMEAALMTANLAALRRSRGDLAEAERLALRADAIFARFPAGESQRGNRQILGSIYIAQHRFSDAEALFHRLLDGATDRQAASIYSNLTASALGRGGYQEAEDFALRSVELSRRTLPPGHPLLAAALNNLAQALRFEGQYLQAEKRYREALAIWEEAFGPRHPDVAKGLVNLAAFYHERGREVGAEDLYSRAAGIFEQAFGRDNPQALIARNELGEVLRAERRFTESETLARATLPGLEKAFEPQDPRLVRALSNYARLLDQTRRQAKAREVLNRIGQGPASFR